MNAEHDYASEQRMRGAAWDLYAALVSLRDAARDDPFHTGNALLLAALAEADVAIKKATPAIHVPYPEFCRHPDICAGKSSCPRDPCCCD